MTYIHLAELQKNTIGDAFAAVWNSTSASCDTCQYFFSGVDVVLFHSQTPANCHPWSCRSICCSFAHVKFYISGANVPGEGEVKCIDWLKQQSNPGSEESAVIVGGDADLILQGLTLSEVSAQQHFCFSSHQCFMCMLHTVAAVEVGTDMWVMPLLSFVGPAALPRSLSLHCQVKNTFICSATGHHSFRLSSIWEVVRSLDALLPGQSEFVRNDVAVLIMLNGNDYLPKVRGVSFQTCFQAYTALKKGKHR